MTDRPSGPWATKVWEGCVSLLVGAVLTRIAWSILQPVLGVLLVIVVLGGIIGLVVRRRPC